MELFGDGIDAFYPVLRTDDIGNLGTICCSDGEYPEAVRALAFNDAEVVYRPSEAVPMTNVGYPGGRFEGAKYFPMDPDLSPTEAWKVARQLWADEVQDGADG